jgi:hypothetical protein
VANTVGENTMTHPTVLKWLSLLTILLTPIASATYYYDTDDIQQRVISEAKRQNLPPSLALAIAKVESNFNHKALSHAGAKGVMQIMPRTAEQVFGVSRNRLFEPDINIELGVRFIKKLLKRYDDRLEIALSHYNGGSRVRNKHGELSVMPATRNYVDKVLTTQREFLRYDNYFQGDDYFQGDNYFQQKNYSKHDNPPLYASHFNHTDINQSGIMYVDENTGEFQADSQMFDTHSQDPQIETLRALRLHNITRNYKGNRAHTLTNQPDHSEKSANAQVQRHSKIKKVRQWESIYPE